MIHQTAPRWYVIPIASLLSSSRANLRSSVGVGIVDLLPAFDERVQVARVDEDPSHRTTVVCARARNADRGDVAADHEIAQRPIAAAKIRRCRSKVHKPATWWGRSLTHGNTC